MTKVAKAPRPDPVALDGRSFFIQLRADSDHTNKGFALEAAADSTAFVVAISISITAVVVGFGIGK